MTDISGRVEAFYEIEGGPVPMGYITRGHVDKAAFVAEIRTEFGRIANVEHVAHAWLRNTPWDGPDGWTMVANTVEGPGRGVYAVTSIEQGWTEEATP